MALGDKTPAFSVADRFKKVNENKESTLTPTTTPTGTDTPTYAPAHFPTRKPKERKSERLQLTVRPSTKARLALYAEDHNTSSNEVVQRLVEDLLDNAGY